MPQICYFYGITIYVQFLDHNPPHIHCVYQGYKGQYEISTGKLLADRMPNKVNKMVQEWIQLRSCSCYNFFFKVHRPLNISLSNILRSDFLFLVLLNP